MNLSESLQFLNAVADTYASLTQYPVCPKVEPGFLRETLPPSPPEKPLPMPEIIKESFDVIQAGAVQWQHPNFFGYFPSSMSHSTILAEMWANTWQTRGGDWEDSPSQTEIEMGVVDWVVKMMGLPEKFLLKNEGGGTICTSVTHGYFNAVTTAKHKKMKELNLSYSSPEKFKFAAYFSEPAFGWSEKALNLKEIKHQRKIPVYFNEKVGNYEPNMEEFEKIIEQDVKDGLIPFFCAATYGYTATCGFDDVEAIGKLCRKYGMFLLADAAYACSFLILEEYRHKFTGLDYLDCLIVNFSKNFMTSNVGTIFYINDKILLTETFGEDSTKFPQKPPKAINYKDWAPGCSRKFNSLKIYFLIKHFGVKGLQTYIRNYIDLAKVLEELMKKDERFVIVCKREVSVIVFIIKTPKNCKLSTNDTQREFYKICLEDTREGYFSFTHLGHEELLRFVVGNPNTKKENVEGFWRMLVRNADRFYESFGEK